MLPSSPCSFTLPMKLPNFNDRENFTRKCNFGFLQLFLDYSMLFGVKNVTKIGISDLEMETGNKNLSASVHVHTIARRSWIGRERLLNVHK